MRRHAAAVVLVLMLAGCVAEPVGFEAEPAATSSAPTKPKASPSTTKAAKKSEPIPADLRQYLEDNFTGTSWLDNIKAVTEEDGQHWVLTDLKPTDRDRASKICSAVSGYQVQDGVDGFKGVRVSAAGGERIVFRKDISESC